MQQLNDGSVVPEVLVREIKINVDALQMQYGMDPFNALVDHCCNGKPLIHLDALREWTLVDTNGHVHYMVKSIIKHFYS